MRNILITGSAGFIGFHLTKAILAMGYKVVGIDNLNNYYDPELKKSRLQDLEGFVDQNNLKKNYHFKKLDISQSSALNELFTRNNFDIVINLAAQAGVRYSIENPSTYINSNLVGFANILESCRNFNIKHLIFASSSSVYGMNKKHPFSENDITDKQVSLYAATKKSNELMAHSYSHLYGIPITGLRFFTVYGPYGRPDMAYFLFVKAIEEGREILVNNGGKMERDFTYIDDIVEGILKLLFKIPPISSCNISDAKAPFRVLNIGNNNPVTLMRFIKAIETAMNTKAKLSMQPMQAGDVPLTYADIRSIDNLVGFKPTTSIEDGILKFVDWYKSYK